MKADDILKQTAHRPFPLPEGKWLIRQAWHDLLFAHWQVPAELIAPFVPKELQLDLWEGAAWISLVPFHVQSSNMRELLPLPFVGSFYELNMRTYVTYRNQPGAYFFSLDASEGLAVTAARLAGLPYFNANISMNEGNENLFFHAQRADPRGHSEVFAGTYSPLSDEVFRAEPNTQLHWLTERYRLFFSKDGAIMAGDIHHLPWPLQSAELVIEQNTMTTSLGIKLPKEAALITYTKHHEALVWPPKNVEQT